MSNTVLDRNKEYLEEVEEVRKAFERLPRGARSQASHDLRVSASSVSSVLNGTLVNRAVLAKLRAWADGHPVGPATE